MESTSCAKLAYIFVIYYVFWTKMDHGESVTRQG